MMFDPSTHSIKFIDLGLAVIMDKEKKAVLSSYRGTPDFMAPELVTLYENNKAENKSGKYTYNEKTEVYAMGKTLMDMFGVDGKGMPDYSNISDPEMRKEVKNYLCKMTDRDPIKRPTLNEAIKYFERVRELQLRAPDLLNRVATVNIEEHKESLEKLAKLSDALIAKKSEIYAMQKEKNTLERSIGTGYNEGSEEARLQELNKKLKDSNQDYKALIAEISQIPGIDLLKKADEVWLVSSQASEAELVRYKRTLEDLGMIVNNQAFVNKDEVESYVKQREDKDRNIYICASLSKEGELNYPDKVSHRHLDKILYTLESDRVQLLNKNLKENSVRARYINKCIDDLQKERGNLTYTQLDGELQKLQKKLYSNNGFKEMLEKHVKRSRSDELNHVVEARKELKEFETKLRPR